MRRAWSARASWGACFDATEAGAKVVLVGDPEQLQAIEAGAAFRSIHERHGGAKSARCGASARTGNGMPPVIRQWQNRYCA